ncbi:high affinity immunoglobulin alpha and immunoglobulin mu Fc receptor [Saccopteryx bilineata]|uniref:high affinity immunoglobulin alpha and immunoglobulin mu Fc receptor n=1 Tax=Saccopteryx bilineata TaxID=59482 RepID=UPI00338DF7AF
MDAGAPAKPEEQKCILQVANQREGWKIYIVLLLCLLQAANALKGPRLVSGEPGGTVTIRCHYTPSPINRHQRKYWCRLNSLTWLCHTIVSTNHYTHIRYSGRVALLDFPHGGLFVVRLSQLSPDDAGSYRCGIGNRNSILFSNIKLTVSAGPAGPGPRASPAASELIRRSFGTASPAANRWTPATTQTIEKQGTERDSVALTPGISKNTASAKGMQSPETLGVVAAGTVSQVESAILATILIPESSASTLRGLSNTTEGAWVGETRSSVADRARASWEERETTMEASRPREETEKVSTSLNTNWTVLGTISPSPLASEKWAWETRQEAQLVSKPQTLGSTEETTGAAGMWTLQLTSTEMPPAEGSTEGDLDIRSADSELPTPPSQAPEAGPLRPPGKESSVKRASSKEKNIARILTPVSTVLLPLTLVTLVLLQRKLWLKRTSQETEKAAGVTLIQMTHFRELSLQPDQLPHVERKILWDDSPPSHDTMAIPERDPGS